jgi:hypothetical protein
MTGVFCRDGWWSGLSLRITLSNSVLFLNKPVTLTEDSSINNIAEDSEIVDTLWKKPPGVSNVLVVPPRYAVFADFMQPTTPFGKNMKMPCSDQDVSIQDFRRPQVLPWLQSCASRPLCQLDSFVGPHMNFFGYDSPLDNNKANLLLLTTTSNPSIGSQNISGISILL